MLTPLAIRWFWKWSRSCICSVLHSGSTCPLLEPLGVRPVQRVATSPCAGHSEIPQGPRCLYHSTLPDVALHSQIKHLCPGDRKCPGEVITHQVPFRAPVHVVQRPLCFLLVRFCAPVPVILAVHTPSKWECASFALSENVFILFLS